jgi:hypothetical protein
LAEHEELPVSSYDNVIPLRPRNSPEGLPVPVERLGAAVRELDGLRRCVEQIVRRPGWSVAEWRAACSPLLLRIPWARDSLADLDPIRSGGWPDAEWAVRVRARRAEVERRLLDVSMAMNTLVTAEAGSAEAAVSFCLDGARLAEATRGLCTLIVSEYPAAVGDG